jgi:hypothetical protein
VVPDNMDALEWLRTHLEAEGSDLLREMVRTFPERLMSAEVEVLCNAGCAEVTPERTNSRLSISPAGHPCGFGRSVDPEAAGGQLLPGLAARTAPAGSAGAGGGGGRVQDSVQADVRNERHGPRSRTRWSSRGRTAARACPQGVLNSVISGCSLAISRIRNFWTFPEMVIGNSSMNRT